MSDLDDLERLERMGATIQELLGVRIDGTRSEHSASEPVREAATREGVVTDPAAEPERCPCDDAITGVPCRLPSGHSEPCEFVSKPVREAEMLAEMIRTEHAKYHDLRASRFIEIDINSAYALVADRDRLAGENEIHQQNAETQAQQFYALRDQAETYRAALELVEEIAVDGPIATGDSRIFKILGVIRAALSDSKEAE